MNPINLGHTASTFSCDTDVVQHSRYTGSICKWMVFFREESSYISVYLEKKVIISWGKFRLKNAFRKDLLVFTGYSTEGKQMRIGCYSPPSLQHFSTWSSRELKLTVELSSMFDLILGLYCFFLHEYKMISAQQAWDASHTVCTTRQSEIELKTLSL